MFDGKPSTPTSLATQPVNKYSWQDTDLLRSSRSVEAGLVESLALPGGNVTGTGTLNRELGGKRLELLKEAVPKLARVAVLYDPANPATELELKEVLRVVTRSLGLTVQSWAVRTADDPDKVFIAINQDRPDGLYASGEGPANAC